MGNQIIKYLVALHCDVTSVTGIGKEVRKQR